MWCWFWGFVVILEDVSLIFRFENGVWSGFVVRGGGVCVIVVCVYGSSLEGNVFIFWC